MLPNCAFLAFWSGRKNMMPQEPVMMPGEAFAPQPRAPRPADFEPKEFFPTGHMWRESRGATPRAVKKTANATESR